MNEYFEYIRTEIMHLDCLVKCGELSTDESRIDSAKIGGMIDLAFDFELITKEQMSELIFLHTCIYH